MALEQTKKEHIDLSRLAYLVIERDRATRAFLFAALRNFSATQIDLAHDSKAAFDLIEQRHPDVILLGLTHWQVDDMGLVRLIRRSPNMFTSHIPIIVFSNGASAEDVSLALMLGADSHVTVPFTVATLEAHLLKALGDPGLAQLAKQ